MSIEAELISAREKRSEAGTKISGLVMRSATLVALAVFQRFVRQRSDDFPEWMRTMSEVSEICDYVGAGICAWEAVKSVPDWIDADSKVWKVEFEQGKWEYSPGMRREPTFSISRMLVSAAD